jgi:polyisoprenoid-binding protein YceI
MNQTPPSPAAANPVGSILSASSPFPSGAWELDPSQTTVTVAARKLGLFTVPATLQVKSGSIEINDDHQVTSVEVVADAASYTSANDKRNAHIRSGDFLNSEAHPSIVFRTDGLTTNPNGYQSNGTVTIKGQTTPLVVDIEEVEFDSSSGTFSASASVDRNELGITKFPSWFIGRTLTLTVTAAATLSNPGGTK